MSELSDMLGKPKPPDNFEVVDVDGMCYQCYYPFNHGNYYATEKKLELICVNDHREIIDWEFYNG